MRTSALPLSPLSPDPAQRRLPSSVAVLGCRPPHAAPTLARPPRHPSSLCRPLPPPPPRPPDPVTDLLPDPALAGVVRPMILQFFVLAVLWMQLVAPGARGGRPADWTRVLLPFLMIATGLLFFSSPLQPVWAPLLGPGGDRVPAIPAGTARALVLGMNLGVVGWCAWHTGGLRRSPLIPLLVALPFAAILVEGDRGGWLPLLAGTATVLTTVIARAGREETRPPGALDALRSMVATAGVLVLLALAAWLGWGSGGKPDGAGTPRGAAAAFAGQGPCAEEEGGEDCLRHRLDAGVAVQRAGRLEEADMIYRDVAEAADAEGLATLEAEALVRRAGTSIRLAGLAEALELLEVARARLGPEDRRLRALVECQRGTLLGIAGDPGAIDATRKGLAKLGVDVRPGEPTPSGHLDAPTRHTLGACLFSAGQHFANRARVQGDSAVMYLRTAAEVQLASGDRYGRAASLQWLAGSLRTQARFLDALTYHDLALEEARLSGNVSAEAWAEFGMAGLLADLGDPSGADAHMTRALEAMEASGDRVGLGFGARFKADLAIDRGRPDLADALLEQAVETLAALGNEHAARDVLPARLRAARALGDTTRILRDIDALLDATNGGEVVLPSALPRLAAVGGLLQVGQVQRAGRILESAGGPGSSSWIALWTWSMRKAEVAALTGDLVGAETHAREALDWMARLRVSIYSRDLRLGALAIRGTDLQDPDLGVATVLAALAAGGRAPEAFAMAAELRGRDLEQERVRSLMLAPEAILDSVPPDFRRGTAVDEVQRHLSLDEAMLLYVTGQGGEPTTLFVVTGRSLHAHRLAPVDDLVPLVARLRSQVAAADDARGLRARLGGELLGAALADLPAGIRRLVVIPDHGLHSVPFDALIAAPVAGGSRALVEQFQVVHLPSPLFLAGLRATDGPTGARGVLALSRGSPAVTEDRARLPRLRWVGAETRAVARRIPGSRRLTGRHATPGALLAGVTDGYAVLHVAAHARVDAALPARSAILLAPGPTESPGILRLADIESRSLPFRLVVLSACSTAEGREDRGEGLRGPARAFLSAGSRSVVATAWEVGDRAAARQMRAFYAELARGAEVAEALARVKRREIAAGRPPRDWAAFQLHGDPGVQIVPGTAPDSRVGAVRAPVGSPGEAARPVTP